jgi:hypothetical protein
MDRSDRVRCDGEPTLSGLLLSQSSGVPQAALSQQRYALYCRGKRLGRTARCPGDKEVDIVSIAREQPALATRLDVTALANAVTAIALAAYIICATVAIVAPDLLIWFFQPWFHGLSLDPLRPTGAWFRPGEAIVGLITFGGSVWVGTAAAAWLYNAWSRH